MKCRKAIRYYGQKIEKKVKWRYHCQVRGKRLVGGRLVPSSGGQGNGIIFPRGRGGVRSKCRKPDNEKQVKIRG
jgi:hypothetical protein